jgi:two-component system cell cycle response regulator
VRVLIAEDDDATRDVLEVLLSERGYEVVVARDGSEAWDLLQQDDAPSLAILDWLMPGQDGAELCRKVRQSGKPNIYILMLTVKGEREDLIAGIDAGADDYIRKPADVDELCARLRAGERIVRQQEELRLQATHDDLTGVLNRGTILGVLKRELAHGARNGVPVAVILADVDDFKQVNDTHGHAIGDAVLCEVSKRLAAPMRVYDAIGRYGGEEFLIVLSACEAASAVDVAERVRCSVASAPLNTAAGAIAITVSLGVAAVGNGQSLDVDALILAADNALYRAKRAGRNRVEGAPLELQHNLKSARTN